VTEQDVASRVSCNTADHLVRSAQAYPRADAVRTPSGKGWRKATFAELDQRSSAIANGLVELGLKRGDRVSVFLREGIELVAVTYALFKLGAVPVLIDPGMGRRALAACVAKAAPRALIAVPAAQVFRALHPSSFRSVEHTVVHAARWPFGASTLAQIEARGAPDFDPVVLDPTDPAAVLFTSGSTGPPKGVLYTHGMFAAQIRTLRGLYDFQPGEVDVACFPLFALFDVAFGMTSVFPRLDASHPGRCNPEDVIEALQTHEATNTFGSPAIWRRVAPWCFERGIRLEAIRRILVAGAPVPPSLVSTCHSILSEDGDVYTPYGATEALPVASIDGRSILALRGRTESGAGTCVGTPAPEIDIRLIRIEDDPLPAWDDVREVAHGELGEICVRGPVVTRSYLDEPQATNEAKVLDGAGHWHRMGDVGYLDDDGRLWFCGRKAHRLETEEGLVLPVPAENVLNLHPSVRRTALVGVGPRPHEVPTLVVEPEKPKFGRHKAEREQLAEQLRELIQTRWSHGPPPHIARVRVHPGLPVDVRHNAKIRREVLKRWAEEQPP
jgi:acyl-CoA synthetase (AMP-forming)/AMP-acid ligase II